MLSTMICRRIGRITYIGLAAPPGQVCRVKPLVWPARSTFTPWRLLRNIWGRAFLLSGRKRIGFYQIDPEGPAVLTGGSRGKREKDFLIARKRPVSAPLGDLAVEELKDLEQKSNHSTNPRRAPSAELIALKAQGARLKAQGKSPLVSSR